jgi:hypothetical protein
MVATCVLMPVNVATGAIIAVPMHMISLTDLPSLNEEGRMVKKSSSAVDVAQAEKKTAADEAV